MQTRAERLKGYLSPETISEVNSFRRDVLNYLASPKGQAEKYPKALDDYTIFHMAYERCLDALISGDKFGSFAENANKITTMLQPHDGLVSRFFSLMKAWDADLVVYKQEREKQSEKEMPTQDQQEPKKQSEKKIPTQDQQEPEKQPEKEMPTQNHERRLSEASSEPCSDFSVDSYESSRSFLSSEGSFELISSDVGLSDDWEML